MLLIGLAIGRILVQKLRTPCLDLRVQNHLPDLLSRNRLATAVLLLLLNVEILKLRTPHVRKTRCLIGRKERPHTIGLHTLHKKIGNPETLEEITRTLLFGTLIILHAKEVLNIRMPRLQLDRKRPRTLATLIDLASRIIEDAEHGNNSRGLAIRALNASVLATNVVNAETNATRPLGDLRTIPQRLVDALNAVIIHRQEEARRELWMLRARIEERWSRMDKEPLRKKILGLLDLRKVVSVKLNGYAHPHMLRTLLASQKLSLLQSLESKIVKQEITGVVDHGLLGVAMLADNIMVFIADCLDMMLQILHTIQKRGRRVLLVIVNDNTSRKLALIGVLTGLHHGTGLCRKLIEFRGLHSIAELGTHLLGNNIGIDVFESFGKVANPLEDLVERNGLTLAIPLHNFEMFRHTLLPRHTLKRENYTNLS